MTNDKMRLLTADELESVVGGDYVANQPCDVDVFSAGGHPVLRIPFFCPYFW
jgi:hypothetical protein